MANKSKSIDKEQFERLLNEGKNKKEIRAILGVGDSTLSIWIAENYDGKKFTDISSLKAGRPVTNIDKHKFEELCKAQATQEEICQALGVCQEALINWIKRTYPECANYQVLQHAYAMAGKGEVKLAQYKYALQNPEFSKWWGKQYLGQRDVVEQEIKAVVNDTHSQIIDKLSQRVKLEDDNGSTNNN